MNAALIAACAANARRTKLPASLAVNGTEIYYNVQLRKFYKFSAITIVTPSKEYYTDTERLPIRHLELVPVQLPPKTIVIQRNFPVAASKCTNGIDRYVEDNPELFKESRVWEGSDEEVFNQYAAELCTRYCIEVKPGSIPFVTEFYMEVI